MNDQHETAALLDGTYAAVTAVVGAASSADLRRPTRTEWTVRELLVHLLLDAQRCLVALSTPATGFADTDRVSYWRDHRPGGEGAAAHAEWVRKVTAAYSQDAALVAHWTTTSRAAVHAARVAESDVVMTQGHSMAVADLLDTLVVEAVVHYLDLTAHLTGPPVDPQAVGRVRSVLNGLLGGPMPEQWTDEECVLKGTGRLPLSADDRESLGTWQDRFPLLG
ncbi:maleylpyruvate isomerase N-terminal domain-containing protein [Luteipulveratus sp. YIM 133132]|uniref:maleylpyruvate isomerase N-terminal domain-containing protein n=1 Tax=Luteipulveratus flavus TaxID=3031728 RepID=UPI0023AFE5B0|nr:maleylpyruvate isomerase N-terminal domain-containing protein [Luteipulveratus sp. YIM 133132]MDE9366657.1 maleylpyruvate isomerase N-terminal domain-containing protein [Luteipulveratus sp. YIM 133132]